MSRRLLILLLPALALIVWLVAAQLPLWTAPQTNWFAQGTPEVSTTPGVCAAVESLTLYGGTRTNPAGIGREAAAARAAQVVTEYYDTAALTVSEPLAVDATVTDERRAYFVVTARLTDDEPPGSLANTATVIYVDAETGEPAAVITALDDPAADCDLNLRETLVTALKSPPTLLLVAYGALAVIAAGVAAVRRNTRGQNRS